MRVNLGLTDRGRATAAAGATLSAAGTLLGFVDLTRVGVVALVVVFLAVALVQLSRPRLKVETSSPASAQVGGSATWSIRLSSSRRSAAVRLEQPLPPALGGTPIRAAVPALGTGQSFDVTSRFTLSTRGRHEIPPAILTREDPFGFAGRRTPAGHHRTITVLPRVHPLASPPSNGASLRSEGAAQRLSALPGDQYGAIRTYTPGDDLRRIHWPVTAHSGELMTRHDERTSARHALLVLDPRLADRAAPRILEWGIEMVASAAVALDHSGVSVDLLAAKAGGSADVESGPAEELLTTLALIPTTMRPPRLKVAVEDPFVGRLREHATRASVVVLVAGVTDPGTRDLLLSLPPGTAGYAFLVAAADTSDAQETPSPATVLNALGSQAGWAVVSCTPATPHGSAWQAVLLGEGRA